MEFWLGQLAVTTTVQESQRQYSLSHATKSHQQGSLEAGRHRRHRPRGEEEALEMAWPCTSHEEGPPSIRSTDMGSTWEEGQRQTAGHLETVN